MKNRVLIIFGSVLFIGAGLFLSRNAYANTDRNSVDGNFQLLDSPPVRHIAPPVRTATDTAKGTHVEVQRRSHNENPTHVVNPQ